MKIINKSNTVFKSIFGDQNAENKNLILAPYCMCVPCEDGTLIYNALSLELVLLSNEESKKIQDINSLTDEISNYLKKGWFYIPNNLNANRLCDQLRNTLINLSPINTNGSYHNYTIMTTLECNARCFYCFQRGVNQPKMSRKTANDIAEYIINHNVDNKTLNITWFGGEPLYNYEVIDIILSKIKSANMSFKSGMISNGFLFNDSLIRKSLNEWNLKKVQITLDGTEQIYNRSKNYINTDGINPFNRVINNIEQLIKNGINVSIRLNIAPHNIDDLFKLVDLLADKFSSHKNFSIYAHRLFDYNHNENKLYSNQEIKDSVKTFCSLNDYFKQKGLKSNGYINIQYNTNNCLADSNSSLSITPDGNITKCRHFSDTEIIGDIYSDELDTKLIGEWKELQPALDICEDCAAYMDCRRLKKCPDISSECDIYQKEEQLHLLKLKILNTYTKWKEKSDNKKTGD